MNVLIAVLDAVRADHVSCYGYDRPTTPNLDAFAASATRFEVGISPGVWTFPSMTSMLTGLYASQHGMNRANRPLDPALQLLPETLKAAGWRTACFSANPYVGRNFGFNRGFDVFEEFWGVSGGGGAGSFNKLLDRSYRWLRPRLRTVVKRSQLLTRSFNRYLRHRTKSGDKGGRALADRAAAWLRAGGEGPSFTLVHFMEPHGPLAPPLEYRRRYLSEADLERAEHVDQDAMAYMAGANPLSDEDMRLLTGLYDASISYVDGLLGSLLEACPDDTLVVVTADHGNNFGEHGLMDHFFSVHETLARVPLVVRHPRLAAGVERRPVQSVDIAPTVLEAAGLVPDGMTGVPLTAGADPRSCMVTEYLDPDLSRFDRFHGFDPARFGLELRGLRREGWKFIWRSDGQEELFDLANDPSERNNLAPTEPGRVTEFRELHDEWQAGASVRVGTSGEPVDLDPEVRETLRDFGYFD